MVFNINILQLLQSEIHWSHLIILGLWTNNQILDYSTIG